jgi:probable HAF family extracellular repeat protein
MFPSLWSRRTKAKRTAARHRGRHPSLRLHLERLEARFLPSGYTIIDIGPALGSGINNAAVAQVVGSANGHAYLWDSIHGMQNLGTIGADQNSQAYSVNNAGQVTGESTNSRVVYIKKTGQFSYDNSEEGFLWSSSHGMKSIGPSTFPAGINASGEISGTDGVQAVLWTGHSNGLGTLPGGRYSWGAGINDYGQVVGHSEVPLPGGNYDIHAFLWTPSNPDGTTGVMIDLGTSADTSFGGVTASAVNSQGFVTGIGSGVAEPNNHAFLWIPSSPNGTTGTIMDLGALAGNQSSGLAINSGGVVVGNSLPATGLNQDQTHAVIWQPGTGGSYTISDLNNLIPTGTGWTLLSANGINDSGQIVVEATQDGVTDHALLLTPTMTTPLAQPASSVQPVMPSSSPGGGQSAFTLGPLVEISNPDPLASCPPGILPANAAAEPYVAVNPVNPKNIVAEWIDHGFAGNVAGASFDGGKTWQNVAIPGIAQCTGGTEPFSADPWLSFAPNGDLYSIGVGWGGANGAFLVNKSTDGGLTWSNPIQLNTTGNPARDDDKPSITADPSNANFVYATWARFTKSGTGNNAETMFARSTDGGQTWQPEQDIHDAPGTAFNWGNQIVVLPDGTVIDAFAEGQYTNNHQVALTLLRSTDHGQTWSAPISAVVQQPLVDPNVQPPNAIVTDPDTGQLVEAHPVFSSIAVDRANGNLYAVWIDARFSNFQYNSIALSMSSDGGFTWSTPIQANQTPNTVPPIDRQAWNPTVAVSANGTVAVTYYDFRNNTPAPGALTDYWLAFAPAPATNPANWSEVRLTDTSFNLEQAPTRMHGDFFLGDYEGLAAAGNNFVAVWGMPDGSATGQESIFFRDPPAAGAASAEPSTAAPISTTTVASTILFTDTWAMSQNSSTASTITGTTSAVDALTPSPWWESWLPAGIAQVQTFHSQSAVGANQTSHNVWSDPASNLITDGLVNDLIAQSVMDSLVSA